MNYQKCTIEGCKAQIPDNHLMCPPHWRKVPTHLKNVIVTSYRMRKIDENYYRTVELAKAVVATSTLPRYGSWRDMFEPGEFRTRPKRTA